MANDPVVFPNTFMDGLDGRTPIPNYNGEPRRKCESSGEFQIAQTPNPTNPIVVTANGFSRVNVPNPPTYPNGQETFIQPGTAWQTAVGPTGFWPPRPYQGSSPRTAFETGIPVHVPYWSSVGPGDILPMTAPLSAPTSASAHDIEQPTGPEPPRRPPPRGHR